MNEQSHHGHLPVAHAVLEAGEAPTRLLVAGIERRMTEMSPGQILKINAVAANAQGDILAWCRVTGNQLIALVAEGEYEEFWIRKRSPQYRM